MKSFSKWRYERTLGNCTSLNDGVIATNYEICFYDNPKEMKFIFNKIGRVMIQISYNKYITLCFTDKHIFRPFIWDWFYNIDNEKRFINKYKDMFMKYWYGDDKVYNCRIYNIMRNICENNMNETESYENERKIMIKRGEIINE